MKRFIAIAVMMAVGQIPMSLAANPPDMRAVLVAGNCTKLAYRTVDLTEDCSKKLVNTAYSDGRTGFMFVAKHTIITFSGDGKQQFVRQNVEFFSPLDKVVFQSEGSTIALRAVGWCQFMDPTHGIPVSIHCVAETEEGRFEGSFFTDGSKPEKLGN